MSSPKVEDAQALVRLLESRLKRQKEALAATEQQLAAARELAKAKR